MIKGTENISNHAKTIVFFRGCSHPLPLNLFLDITSLLSISTPTNIKLNFMKAIYIPQSHDAMFKQFLHDKQMTKQFMQLYLPYEVKKICDLDTLQLQSSSFIEPDLKQRFNDILYSVKTKLGKGYIYCLVEHQSRPDRFIAFRLMLYAIMAMNNHIKQGNKKLPLVIPMLFYTGKKRHPKNIPLDWHQLFNSPKMAKKIYNHPFKLIETSQINDSELRKHLGVGLLKYLFKHIYSCDLFNMLNDLRYFMSLNQVPKELIESSLIYLFDRGKIEQPQGFLDALFKETTLDGDKIMATLSEYLREQGKQQGIFLGREEGIELGSHNTKVEIANHLLNKGISIDFIKETTGLSDNEIKQLVK